MSANDTPDPMAEPTGSPQWVSEKEPATKATSPSVGDEALRRFVWELIEKTEKQLRDLVQDRCRQEWGDGWQNQLCARHEDLAKRWLDLQIRDRSTYEIYGLPPETLLSYSTLGELEQIMIAEWQLFRGVFLFKKEDGKANKKALAESLDLIVEARNRLAHNRYAPGHDLRRARVACDEIRMQIAKWRGESLPEDIQTGPPEITAHAASMQAVDVTSVHRVQEQNYLVALYQILAEHLDEEEAKTLCFSLDVDYDDLPAKGKSNKARELVEHLERRGRIPELIEKVTQMRQDIILPERPDQGVSMPNVANYLQSLVNNLRQELAEEQYAPLGLYPEDEVMPLDEIEADLLATNLSGVRTGRKEVASSQPLGTLGEVLKSGRTKFVLLGEPGSGKTTTLKRLALYTANLALASDRSTVLPLYVPLVDYQGVFTLTQLILASAGSLGLELDEDQLKRMLKHGGLLLLFDSLNEVPPGNYAKCRAELSTLMRWYPRNRFVITDRPTYDGTLQAPVFRLDDWEPERIRRYIHRSMHQLGSQRDPEILIGRILYDQELHHALANPLLLGLLTAVYHARGHIASARSQLYYDFIQILIARDRQKMPDDPLDDYTKERLLVSLAFAARKQNLTSMTEDSVREHIASQLQAWKRTALIGVGLNAVSAVDSLRRGRWLRDAGTQGQLRFNFDTLQDLFVALALKEHFEKKDESLAEFIADARWEEPVVLLAGLLGRQAEPITEEAWKRGGIHLAARCVISAPMVATKPRVVHLLRKELSSTLEVHRRSAAGLFIFLRAPEAVSDLVQALADESGAVRWNASLAIQRTLGNQDADALFVQILENPSHSDATLTTACVALGRSKSNEAVRALIRALAAPSDKVRRRAAIELGHAEDPVAMRLLERAAREGPDPDIQAGAIRALSIAQPDWAQKLARSYLDHPSSQVRTEARLVLGRLGDPEIINECLQQLKTDQPEQCLRAIADLEAMGTVQAIEPFWNLLTDSNLRSRVSRALARIGGTAVIARATDSITKSSDIVLRRAAVKVLGQTNDDRAIEPLITALGDQDNSVRELAAELLENFGGRAVPLLEQTLIEASGPQEEMQAIAALRALRNVGSRMAIQLLAEALNDPRPGVAKMALQYLGQADPEQARLVIREIWPNTNDAHKSHIEPLLMKMESRHHTQLALDYCHTHDPIILRELIEDSRSQILVVRRSATQALGRIREPEAEPSLLELTMDTDPSVRAAAITALGSLGAERRILDRLVEWIQDQTEPLPVRVAIADVLGLSGGKMEQDLLVSLVSTAEPSLAQAAGLAVMKIEQRLHEGIPPIIPASSEAWRVEALEECLESPLSRDRQQAVEELAGLDSPKVETLLLSAAKDKHPFVRYAAIIGLGYRCVKDAVPALGRLLRDENVHLRRATIEALGRISTPQAFQALGDVYREKEVSLRERALDALVEVATDPAAFSSLTKFLGDQDEKLRGRAAAILGMLKPAELNPEHLMAVELALESRNPFIRSGMLLALGNIRAEPTIPLIVAHVRDENFYVRKAAIGALSQMPTAEAIAALGDALSDWAEPIRLEAARALRNSRTPEAFLMLRRTAYDEELPVVEEGLLAGTETPGEVGVLLLEAFVRHPWESVRLKAVEALAEKKLPAVGKSLLPAITDERPMYRNAQLRAIQVVGELRSRDAASPLARLVGRSDRQLRELAAEALEAIGTAEVVPELLKHVNSKNSAVVVTSVKLLGMSHSEEATLPLICRLHQSNPAIQIAVVRALGEIADCRASEPLAGIARQTDNHRLRQEVVSALGRIGDTVAVATLVWALCHPDEETHRWAESTLTQIDPSLVKNALIELLNHSSPRVRQTSARLCGRLHITDSVDALVALLDRDKNPYIQSEAALALGKIGSPGAVAALSRLVETVKDNRYIAKAAVEALVAIGSPDAAKVISGTLQHWAREVRLSAVQGLGQINTQFSMSRLTRAIESEQDEEILSAMLAALQNGSGNAAAQGLAYFMHHAQEAIAAQAMRVLVQNGSERAIRSLVEAMAFEEESLRLIAIQAVGTHGVKQAIPRLLGALRRPKKEDEPTRRAATQALIQIGANSCLPDLFKLLEHRSPYVQQAACRVLGGLKATEAVQPLANLLEVENAYTCQAAAEALRQIASDEAVEKLIGVLQHEDWQVRRVVLRALEEMRVESSVPVIAEMLDDSMFYVRLAAVNALGSIGTPEAIRTLCLAALDLAPDIREKTLELLSAVPPESETTDVAADGLRLLLVDSDHNRRRRVIRSLATNPSHRAVRSLLQAVGDRDHVVREKAIIALGRRKVLEALEALLDARYDPSESVRKAAGRAVGEIRSEVLEQLLDLATRKRTQRIVDWSRSRSKAERLVDRIGSEWVAQEIMQRLNIHPQRKRQQEHVTAGRQPAEDVRSTETYIRLLGWTANPVGQDTVRRAMRARSRFVRLAGIEGAGDLGMEDVVPDILRSARSADLLEKVAAIRALVRFKCQEAIPTLRALVNDENAQTRVAAINALGELKVHEAENEIQQAILDSVDWVRIAAVVAIGEIGITKAVPALIEVLQDPNPAIRGCAASALSKLNARSAANEIIPLLKDPDHHVVEAAIRACGQLRLVEAIDPLIGLRMQAEPPLNNRASLALAEINSPMIVERLAPFAHSIDPKQHRLAIRALARLELKEARDALHSLLGHYHPGIRETVVEALKESPDVSIHTPILCDALEDDIDRIRGSAIRLLASTCQTEFHPLFEAGLGDESPQVRQQAALALGRLNTPTAVSALLSALEGEETDLVRRAIFRALARLRTPEASKALRYWRTSGDASTRLIAIAAFQAERLSEVLEETTSRSPQERLSDPNPYICQAAIRQVGEQGLVGAIPALIPMLKDPNPYTCRVTVEALGLLGDRSVVEPVTGLVESPDPRIRSKVAEALGRLGDERSLEPLMRLLGDDAIRVRYAAIDALFAIGNTPSRDILARHLAQGDPSLAIHIAVKTGEHSDVEWRQVLLHGLQHEDEHVRIEVIRQIAGHSDPVSVSGIRQSLGDPNIQVIREAIAAAGVIGSRELIPLVEEFLSHENSFLRAEAARALGNLGATESLAMLVRATHDSIRQVTSAAALALGQLKLEEAIPALAELVEHPENQVVVSAIRALSQIQTPSAAAALREALDHSDKFVREEVVEKLQRFPPDIYMPYLVEAASDDNHFVREKAVEAMGIPEQVSACQPLAQALADPNVYVRIAAIASLERVGCADALPALVERLEDANSFVRVNAIRAIGKISQGEYQNRLVRLLEDSNSYVRVAAITALALCPSHTWYAAVADLAKNDPILSVQTAARKALLEAATPEATLYVREIDQEVTSLQELLQTPALQSLQNQLCQYQSQRAPIEDEEVRNDFMQCLARAFLTNVPALHFLAGKLVTKIIHPSAMSVYELAIQDPLPIVRQFGAQALATLATSETLNRARQLMATEDVPDVRAALIRSLRKDDLGEVGFQILEAALRDPDRAVVQSAVKALAEIQDPRSIGLLCSVIGHSSDFVREATVNALGRLKAVEAINCVWKATNDSSWYVRQDAISALAQMGDIKVTIEACRKGLADEQQYVQLTAIQTLQNTVTADAIPLLLSSLNHDRPGVRAAAVQGIRACLDVRARPEFATVDWEKAVTALKHRFQNETDLHVQLMIVDALDSWEPRAAAEFLQPYLLERSTPLRRRVLALCERAGELSYGYLQTEFQRRRADLPIVVRRDISWAASRSHPQQCLRLLLTSLGDSDDFVRANAAYGLGQTVDLSAIGPLAQLLRDPARLVRTTAYRALQSLAERHSAPRHIAVDTPRQDESMDSLTDPIDQLLAWLNERNVQVDQASRDTIREDLAAQSMEEIVTQVASNNWLDRWYAVIALGEYRSPEAASTLVRVYLGDENQTVKSDAGRMLRQMPASIVKGAIEGHLQNNNLVIDSRTRRHLSDLRASIFSDASID